MSKLKFSDDLVERAEQEIAIFDRPSVETSIELLERVKALETQLQAARRENEAVIAQLDETRADERQVMRYLEEVRMVISPGRDFPTMISEARKNMKTAELAIRFAKAKGRFHSQQAMCDLLEHLNLPCVRSTRD